MAIKITGRDFIKDTDCPSVHSCHREGHQTQNFGSNAGYPDKFILATHSGVYDPSLELSRLRVNAPSN